MYEIVESEGVNMEYWIDTSINSFLKIIISGVVKRIDLNPVLSEIIMHHDYAEKHTLWDYSSAQLDLNIDDIKELSGILKLIKPKTDNFANKSVIVVPGEMDKAKVDFFISIAKSGPLEFKVFQDAKSAENFLRELCE